MKGQPLIITVLIATLLIITILLIRKGTKLVKLRDIYEGDFRFVYSLMDKIEIDMISPTRARSIASSLGEVRLSKGNTYDKSYLEGLDPIYIVSFGDGVLFLSRSKIVYDRKGDFSDLSSHNVRGKKAYASLLGEIEDLFND